MRGKELVADSLKSHGCGHMLPKARSAQDGATVNPPAVDVEEVTQSLGEEVVAGVRLEEVGVSEGGILERAFGEAWEERIGKIRAGSGFGKHPDWQLQALIVKAMDDLR